ncbi:MAG: BREX system ATP-binding domain-containing protein [Acetobacteraceae bacterium]|jgi:hypothetical protein
MNLEARTAIEALRAGVPNRAAVRLMATAESGIEHAFDELLGAVWAEGAAPRGLGIAGGFGTGKSHMLTYLGEVARTHNFVVSRVVVSKETPLADPARLFEAAMRSAALPGRNDDALAGALAALRAAPERFDALEAAVRASDSRLAPIFAAILFLLRRPTLSPETARRCERFLAGGRMASTVFRQALAGVGAPRMFDVKLPGTADLAAQRIRFAGLLFHHAGYAGWCLLLDEVELIGRYTPLQRGVAYAWLATWLGLEGAVPFPGVATVYAITDDFVAAVIEHRQDTERLSERLLLKGREQESLMAVAAIRHIEDVVQRHRLPLPGLEELTRDCRRLREIYASAYDWPAPELTPGERTATRTMRQYIKAWITQWDMLRLGDAGGAIFEETVRSNYDEDEGLGASHAAPDDEPG